jgi:predicted HicB family RNase H-like nuclease
LSEPAAMIDAMDQYTFRAEWSPATAEYVGMCLEFPSRYARGPTAQEAIAGIEAAIKSEVQEMLAEDRTPPASLTDRRYSGRFVVRTSAELHARLMVDANEQGVSFNQWVVQKLAGRNPPTLNDLF